MILVRQRKSQRTGSKATTSRVCVPIRPQSSFSGAFRGYGVASGKSCVPQPRRRSAVAPHVAVLNCSSLEVGRDRALGRHHARKSPSQRSSSHPHRASSPPRQTASRRSHYPRHGHVYRRGGHLDRPRMPAKRPRACWVREIAAFNSWDGASSVI